MRLFNLETYPIENFDDITSVPYVILFTDGAAMNLRSETSF
jgi:hypothetical protein